MSLNELLADFTNVIDKIFELQEKQSILKNLLKEHYQNYLKVLARVGPEEHVDFFLSPFNKNKIAILADKSDSWIRTNNVFIQFNEGSKKERPKYRIMLSGIYNTSLKFAKEAREEFANLMGNDKLSLQETYPQVKYPDFLLYTYYRIVHYFLLSSLESLPENKDIEKLSTVIKKYETHLGIKNTNKTEDVKSEGKTDVQAALNGNPLGGILSGGGLSDLMNMGVDMARKNGIKIPDDFKTPTGDEFASMINGFLGNPKVKGLFTGMMETMQNAKSPEQLLSGIQQKLGDKDMLQDIMSSVASTTPSVMSNATTESLKAVKTENMVNDLVKDSVSVEENLITLGNESVGSVRSIEGNSGNVPSSVQFD